MTSYGFTLFLIYSFWTLFWKGLVSEEETTPMGHIFDTVDILGPIENFQDQPVKIFTDDSGGKRTKDKRFMRCAWAWVAPKEGSEKEADFGARGALGGEQTVPRAEFRDIHHCLFSIKHHETIKNVTIHSDCKMAVDGFRKGRQHMSPTQLDQLWTLILGCI